MTVELMAIGAISSRTSPGASGRGAGRLPRQFRPTARGATASVASSRMRPGAFQLGRSSSASPEHQHKLRVPLVVQRFERVDGVTGPGSPHFAVVDHKRLNPGYGQAHHR